MFRNASFALLLAVASLTAACKPTASADVAPPVAVDTGAATSTTAPPPVSPAEADVQAPAPQTVLRDIFKESVATADNVRLGDGRYVSYWSGHRFAVDGKRFFVGFAESTAESEIEYPAQDDTVTLSQATYVLENGAWVLRGTQTGIGKFGSFEKPPQIDTDAQPQEIAVGGRYLLGIPTSETAMAGARLDFYELFGFAPRDLSWTYLGYVAGGSDTRAGCTSDTDVPQPVKCAASAATLKFSPSASGNGWPALTVALDGEVVGANGEVRKATPQDAVEYRFDVASGSYSKTLH